MLNYRDGCSIFSVCKYIVFSLSIDMFISRFVSFHQHLFIIECTLDLGPYSRDSLKRSDEPMTIFSCSLLKELN